jgi:hypothetical protein
MSKRITFEALIAKREQREADKLKVGMLDIPGSDMALEARMPAQKVVLEIYGELSAAADAIDALECGKHALYTVCPQLQDRKLQEELGVAEDPMGIIDALFSLTEQDTLGGKALRFMGVLPDTKPDGTEKSGDPGLETVKN